MMDFPQVWHHDAVLRYREPSDPHVTFRPMLDAERDDASLPVDFVDEGEGVGHLVLVAETWLSFTAHHVVELARQLGLSNDRAL